jgi:DNA-binding CsgD family transcriptional regulator
VAALVARGLTNAEVATRLSIAPRTADAHLEHIRLKLNVRSRAEIAAWSTARGLGDPLGSETRFPPTG